jgi:hypothetical protein
VSLHVESFFETKLYLPAIYVPGKQKDSIHWEKIINLNLQRKSLKKTLTKCTARPSSTEPVPLFVYYYSYYN